MMDEFEVFFTFYGLILGLAATEILASLGGLVRDGSLRSMRAQPALLAFLTFLLICATWIDAWTLRASFTLDLRSLWAPIGAATAYYLAAVVVLPKRPEGWQQADAYFSDHKRFVVLALIAAELFVKVMYWPYFVDQFQTKPMLLWIWTLPLNVATSLAFLAMFLARSRRANIAAISAQIVLFTITYWSYRFVTNSLSKAYGYPLA